MRAFEPSMHRVVRLFCVRCHRPPESERQSAIACTKLQFQPKGESFLLASFAELIHILDCRLIDQSLRPPSNLEGPAVVPLDAALHPLSIFQHDHHRRLRLNLLLQIEKLRLAMSRSILRFICRKTNRHSGQGSSPLRRENWQSTSFVLDSRYSGFIIHKIASSEETRVSHPRLENTEALALVSADRSACVF